VARVGGEEFLLVLPGVGLEGARRICERARRTIRDTPIDAGGTSVELTVSLGVAQRREGESRDDVTRRADEALYAAKQAGRDRVIIA
jgi:diguanylate cyclase